MENIPVYFLNLHPPNQTHIAKGRTSMFNLVYYLLFLTSISPILLAPCSIPIAIFHQYQLVNYVKSSIKI